MTDDKLARSIRAIGVFQYFVSIMTFVASLAILIAGIQWHDLRIILFSAPLGMGIAVFYFLLARALRRFKSWARTTTIVICCIGLAGVPIGTIVSCAFLYVLINGKHLFQKHPVPS